MIASASSGFSPRKRRTRAQNSSTSASVKTLPSDSMPTLWRTLANVADGAAPTLRLGDPASTNSGWAASIASRRRRSASYSPSEIVGASSVW